MEQKQGFWRSINPTLKQMQEHNPNLSILGIWWAFTWRLYLIVFAIMVAFWIVAFMFAMILAFHH